MKPAGSSSRAQAGVVMAGPTCDPEPVEVRQQPQLLEHHHPLRRQVEPPHPRVDRLQQPRPQAHAHQHLHGAAQHRSDFGLGRFALAKQVPDPRAGGDGEPPGEADRALAELLAGDGRGLEPAILRS